MSTELFNCIAHNLVRWVFSCNTNGPFPICSIPDWRVGVKARGERWARPFVFVIAFGDCFVS
jgi:hypothetical protein